MVIGPVKSCAPDVERVFNGAPHPYLVLCADPEFTIVDVNELYFAVTGTRRRDLIGRGLFVAFPDNPYDHTVRGTEDLRASLERVLLDRTPDVMGVQKYDIPVRNRPGEFEVKYWSPVNTPIFGPGGEITLILHHVEDVTAFILLQEQYQKEKGERIQKVAVQSERIEAEILRRAVEVKEANRRLKAALETIEKCNVTMASNARQLATVVRDSNDAILLADFDGRIVAWNRGAERIYGYSEAEALKMNLLELVPPDLREDTRLMLIQLQQGKPISSYHTKRVAKDGRVLDIWLTATVLRDDRGRPNLVATTERDMTQEEMTMARLKKTLKELEDRTEQLQTSAEELEVVNEELRSTNDELDESKRRLQASGNEILDYSGIIVDTLEGPLKRLGGGLAALKATGRDPDDRRQAEALLKEEGEATAIVDDLATLLYASRVGLHPERVDLSDMVRSIVGELQAGEPEAKVKFIIPRGVIVYTDKRLLEAAVRRILSNSWRHIPKNGYGFIAFYARMYEGLGIIYFYDNRKEFDPAEFNIFSRPPSGEMGLTGANLGLLVVKKIFDRLDGQFWVDYEYGKGLNICITLPTHPEISV